MMTRNDAVAMQQLWRLVTHFRFCPQKLMDNDTTRAWEFSQTLNQNIEGLARATRGKPSGTLHLPGNSAYYQCFDS